MSYEFQMLAQFLGQIFECHPHAFETRNRRLFYERKRFYCERSLVQWLLHTQASGESARLQLVRKVTEGPIFDIKRSTML